MSSISTLQRCIQIKDKLAHMAFEELFNLIPVLSVAFYNTLCTKYIKNRQDMVFKRFFSLMSKDMMSEQAKTSQEGWMPSENEREYYVLPD